MKITNRDIEIMKWLLEQKFMTERQIRRIFWKGIKEDSRHVYIRLKELEKDGFLRTSDLGIFEDRVYMVRGNGLRQIRAFHGNIGLGKISYLGYSNYRHDLVVTDIRIMFHELGFTQWLSERVLSKRNDLRRVPDGMIFENGKYIAVEYESSQKSKRRYREIFYNYELDQGVDKVLYIVDTEELLKKVSRQGEVCQKVYFVSLDEIKSGLLKAGLKSVSGGCSLERLLEG